MASVAFIVAIVVYGVTLLLYRDALQRHGGRPPLGEVEGLAWTRDLFTRQRVRTLERYRLASLLMMGLAFAAMVWATQTR
jgi:hypothetical protein